MRQVITEDGVVKHEGDRAFNYYDGKWGVIGRIDDSGWFDFRHDDGSRTLLNGARIANKKPAWMTHIKD